MTTRDYVPEKSHANLTAGRALQIARELQELSQSELARRSGIAQSAISAFESGAQEMGLKRIKVLAEVLGVHPAVIAFPDYGAPLERPRSGTSVMRRLPVPTRPRPMAKKAAAKVSVRGQFSVAKKVAKTVAKRAKKASSHV
jgi:transcriptional regulator with XRE-family HTH domain